MRESFCKQQVGIDPDVLGYQILVKGPLLPDKSEGGVILPTSLKSEQQRRQTVGLVLKIGPSAFKGNLEDRKCEIGDWVGYTNFERTPLEVGEHTLYYINDAHILARYSLEDVEKILRKFK